MSGALSAISDWNKLIGMAIALLTAILLGLAAQAATMYYGYRIPSHGAFVRHFTLALSSTFLLCLAHSMTMFYFIGTGKHLKELVKEYRLGEGIVRETILFKNKLFPPMMVAILLTLAQFILGGGTDTRVVPAWIHQIMAWATLGSNAYCLVFEAKYLAANSRLMNSVFQTIDS